MSYHHQISICCTSSDQNSFPSHFKMNIAHFKEGPFCHQMIALLLVEASKIECKKIPPDKGLEMCIKRVTNFAWAWGKQKALNKAVHAQLLSTQLAWAQVELESFPQNTFIQAAVHQDCHQQLKQLEDGKLRWIQETMQMN